MLCEKQSSGYADRRPRSACTSMKESVESQSLDGTLGMHGMNWSLCILIQRHFCPWHGPYAQYIQMLDTYKSNNTEVFVWYLLSICNIKFQSFFKKNKKKQNRMSAAMVTSVLRASINGMFFNFKIEMSTFNKVTHFIFHFTFYFVKSSISYTLHHITYMYLLPVSIPVCSE